MPETTMPDPLPPCIGRDPLCPCQDGDACHYRDAADGTKALPIPGAMPLLPAHADQARTMTLAGDTWAPHERGHWYSPAAVRATR